MTPRRVRGPAGHLFVDDGGSGGPAVVFVHGLAGSTRQWRAQLNHVRVRRRAVALDLRGHGRSDVGEAADHSLPAYADDLAAVVDALHLDPFCLVGHSMGGGVAIAYAARHPQQVERLLLVDPVGDSSLVAEDETAELLAALNTDYRVVVTGYFNRILDGATPSTRGLVQDDLDITLRRTVIESFRKMPLFDLRAALATYAGPRLSVITSFNDMPYSLHNLDPALPVRTLHGTSHWIQLDSPDELNAILDEFCAV